MRRFVNGMSCLTLAVVLVSACADVTPTPAAPSQAAEQPTATPAAPVSFPPPTTTPSIDPPASASPPAAKLEGQIVFENYPNASDRSQIWIEDADGSNARQLVTSTGADNSPTLSPDGRTVVFDRAVSDSPKAALADPTLWDRTMIVNVDGTGVREVHVGGPSNCVDAVEGDAWSPDGKRLALTRVCFNRKTAEGVGGGIWTIGINGSGAREVTRNDASSRKEDHRAGWSPDGKHLVFARIDTSVTPERSAIFTVNPNGSHLSQVTPWKLDANDPVWSPDGTVIAFNSPAEAGRGGEQNIYTIQPGWTIPKQLTSHLDPNADEAQGTFHPSWSPDGTQILFTHFPGTRGTGDLYVMNRDGSGFHAIAETALAENHADWGRSPQP